MPPFEAFYASVWQHPILLWLAAVLAAVFCVKRSGLSTSVLRYCLALTGLSLVDAWLTTTHVFGVGVLTGAAASLVPLFFVLAGDFRYLVLLGTARPDGALSWRPRPVAIAVALTLVVPVSSQWIVSLLPYESPGPRVLFFVYEVLFFILTATLLLFHPAHRRAPWLRTVSGFVLLYYGLWATADAILLTSGSDLGFLLRVVPNVLYYGGLIAVIGDSAARARA